MRKLRQLTNSHIESFKAQAVSLNTPVWYQGHDSTTIGYLKT